MSIEGGISAIAATSVSGAIAAPALGAAALGGIALAEGPAFSLGPSLAGFGAKLEAPLNLPAVDRIPSFSLKDTMPYILGDQNLPKGGERFSLFPQINEVPEPLNTGDILSEAEAILASVPPPIPPVFDLGLADINLDPSIEDFMPEVTQEVQAEPFIPQLPEMSQTYAPKVIPQRVQPWFVPISEPVTRTLLKTEPQVKASIEHQTVTESAPSSQPDHSTIVPIFEDQIEEVIEEEFVGVREDQSAEDEEIEDSMEVKVKRIVDKGAIKQRVEEIFEAARKVDQGEVIDGKGIAGELPGQHAKNRSGELNIVDPRGYLFDGSLIAMFKKIAAKTFNSLQEVYSEAPKIVLEDIPVTRGEGQSVTDEDVAKVYASSKGKVPPAHEVIKRVIKKIVKQTKKVPQEVQIIPVEKMVGKNEGRIEDYPKFAAVFAPKFGHNSPYFRK